MVNISVSRCKWTGTDPRNINYHDTEWGVPVHQDARLLEMLILEGAQAGLSWTTVLNKRERYRKVFFNFNAEKISQFGTSDIARLLQDPGIIRNRLKIASAIRNAKAYLKIRQQYGSFDRYIWGFTNGKTILNKFLMLQDIPSKTHVAEKMSKDLLKNGFTFVGPTICYAFMQAVGIVNDHVMTCFRYKEVCYGTV